jgi:hypothetical protein
MAIIYSYPKKTTPNAGDFLVITDSAQPAPNKNRTKSLTVGDLASFVISSQSGITGSGTLDTIPIFTGSTTIGDSIMTFTTGPDTITVGGRLSTTGDLAVQGRAEFNGVYARFNGEIRDGSNLPGTAGQVLSSTGTGVEWVAGDTNTTYDLTGTVTGGSDYKVVLTGSDGTVDNVTFEAGTGITLTDQGSNTVQLQAVNNGTVTGTGTVNKLTKWSSGGTGIQNSNITDNGSLVTIASETNQTGKAVFRNGIVLSNNPGGVTVDDTSMVIGAGNNDIITGADHCLAVGNNNQILTNSDNSISVGQGNTMTEGTACAIFGLSNTITGNNTITERCLVAGFSNNISAAKSAIVLGGSNTLNTNGGQGIILGSSNNISGSQSNDSGYILGNNVIITTDSSGNLQNAFGIGANLDLQNGQMVLGYRNVSSGLSYPPVNYNQGLGETKFVLSVGTQNVTNSNALIITEGGVTRGTSSVAQVPRIVMPTVVGFNFADDTAAAAGGIPIGGLYHNAGALRIRLT